MAPATVCAATLADVDGIATVHLNSFDDAYFQSLFPPNGPGRKYHVKTFEDFLRWRERGLQEAQVWVIRDDQEVVQSLAVIFVVRPEDGGAWDWTRRYPPVVEGMNEDLVKEFFRGMDEQHHKAMGSKEHIYLELIMTHSSARKRGHASALLEHINGIADELDYPLYLDSEASAMRLYERKGYRPVEDVEKTSALMTPMMRPRKSERGLRG
ncbi:Fc.00g008490.m01.CDS01 [Cosmosporella sp. VM-42]